MKRLFVFWLCFLCGGALWAIPPTVMEAFEVSRQGGRVKLSWTTRSEEQNKGFEIERRLAGEKDFVRIGFVEGFGTTEVPTNYTFGDGNMSEEASFYRLRQLDLDGTAHYSEVLEVKGYQEENQFTILTPRWELGEVDIKFGLLLEEQRNATVRLMDGKGKTLQEFAIAVASHRVFAVEVATLAAGEYLLFIDFNDGTRQVLSFVVPDK